MELCYSSLCSTDVSRRQWQQDSVLVVQGPGFLKTHAVDVPTGFVFSKFMLDNTICNIFGV